MATRDATASGEAPAKVGNRLSLRTIISGVIVFVAAGAAALFFVPQLLINNWLSGVEVDGPSARLAVGNAGQVVLFALGGIIALVGVALSLSRHALELDTANENREKEARRVTELEEQRQFDAERELRARFSQAVALLSNRDQPTTRQAGVYALGALADDWQNFGRRDERQVCIDVLCGYLRSKWDIYGEEADDEKRIRSAAFNLIGIHLRPDSGAVNWNGSTFNLQNSEIAFDIDLSSMHLTSSHLDLDGSSFYHATISFSGSALSGGAISLNRTHFNNAKLRLESSVFSGTEVSITNSRLLDSEFWLTNISLESGVLSFSESQIENTRIRFGGAKFNGGNLGLDYMALDSGSISFGRAVLNNTDIDFTQSDFAGAAVRFNDIKFLGGWLNFSYAKLRNVKSLLTMRRL